MVVATVCYCVGSVLARPLVGPIRPLTLTLVQATIGGSALLLIPLMTEPLTIATLAELAAPRVLMSVAFLSVLGTTVAFTLYLVLIRDWGTVHAGLCAFVLPIVALVAGAMLFRDPIGWLESGGAFQLLAAAALTLPPTREPIGS